MANPSQQPSRLKLISLVGAACAATLYICVPKFENTVKVGYKDPVGIVTACTGHTATAVLGKKYTQEECDALLDEDLATHAEGVKACIKVPLKPNEMAAVVSFAFNVGVGKFCGSTMASKLNQGDIAGACAELSRWNKAGGRVLKGLTSRRAAERAMCEGKTP